MTACRNELTLRPEEFQSTLLQVAERDSTVVGLAQVKVTGMDADLLKLFVEPALLGSGVGRLLFEWQRPRPEVSARFG
jgi:N-acetylglutamate synthase-like GNAT family acetyltransferase